MSEDDWEFEMCIAEFDKFKAENIDNPEYSEKYVAFVKGVFQGVSDKRSDLVKKMYAYFGNIPMMVGKITRKEDDMLVG